MNKYSRFISLIVALAIVLGAYIPASASQLIDENVDICSEVAVQADSSLEGTYYIRNVTSARYITPNTGALINISSHVEQWAYDYDKDQAWDIIDNGDGYYKIKNIVDGTYLTSPDSTTSGKKITAQSALSDQPDRQLWKFILQTDGSYQIRAKNRYSYVMSSNAESASNGGNIVQRPATDGKKTQWELIPWVDVHGEDMLDYGLASSSVTVLISGTTALNSTWKPIITASATAWNNSGAGIKINLISSGTSNHTIVAESRTETWYGLCSQWYNTSSETVKSVITLNTSTLTTSIAQSTAVHEMGHLFSLKDNPSATNESIMYYKRDRKTMLEPQLYDVYNVKNKYD